MSSSARMLRGSVVALALTTLAACGGSSGARPPVAAPPAAPAPGTDVTGHQLRGTWRLVTYETIAPNGERTRHPVTGRMTIDPSGRVTVRAQLERQGQPPFVLDYTGQAVIDSRSQMLRVEGASVPRPPSGAPPNVVSAVSLDRARHYQLSGNLLTVTALKAGSKRPVATVVWERE